VLVVRTVDVEVTVATRVVRAGVTRHEHALAIVARSKARNAGGTVPAEPAWRAPSAATVTVAVVVVRAVVVVVVVTGARKPRQKDTTRLSKRRPVMNGEAHPLNCRRSTSAAGSATAQAAKRRGIAYRRISADCAGARQGATGTRSEQERAQLGIPWLGDWQRPLRGRGGPIGDSDLIRQSCGI